MFTNLVYTQQVVKSLKISCLTIDVQDYYYYFNILCGQIYHSLKAIQYEAVRFAPACFCFYVISWTVLRSICVEI